MTQIKETYLHESGGGQNVEHRFAALGQKYEKAREEAPRHDSTADSEEREKLTFFYHPDQLNSTSFVTDIDGNAVQFTSYIPYGEVFVEERNSSFSSSYLFNAKELDSETGLYYYGARYLDPQNASWLSVEALFEKYPGVSPYSYCVGNPVAFVDPDGRQTFGIHGTWSNEGTWKSKKSLLSYASSKFGNKTSDFTFKWSGGNYASYRSEAAENLISHIVDNRKDGEPITFIGHSHGGNVAIEAINTMVEMDEFKDVEINLITVNTPVRMDYQLSKKAQSRVQHINIYDEKDPVQVNGGKTVVVLPENKTTFPYLTGEFGKAGRKFKNAKNVPVNNPQGIFSDFHNSHNRVFDWSE